MELPSIGLFGQRDGSTLVLLAETHTIHGPSVVAETSLRQSCFLFFRQAQQHREVYVNRVLPVPYINFLLTITNAEPVKDDSFILVGLALVSFFMRKVVAFVTIFVCTFSG